MIRSSFKDPAQVFHDGSEELRRLPLQRLLAVVSACGTCQTVNALNRAAHA